MTGGRGGEMNPMVMMALMNGGNGGGFMNMFDGLFNTNVPVPEPAAQPLLLPDEYPGLSVHQPYTIRGYQPS